MKLERGWCLEKSAQYGAWGDLLTCYGQNYVSNINNHYIKNDVD
jgi:hypothetical protein